MKNLGNQLGEVTYQTTILLANLYFKYIILNLLGLYFHLVRTMLEAIISFFPSDGAGAIGALDWTEEERKKLAKEVSSSYTERNFS